MSKPRIYAAACVLFILGVLFLMNPGQLQHEGEVTSVLAERNPAAKTWGQGLMTKNLLLYHNYIVFSTTTIGGERLSTGFAGTVWVRKFGPGELQQLLDNAAMDQSG